MSGAQIHYPKFLAFIALIYPHLFEELAQISKKADLVEAKLLSSNCDASFQAIVFSEGAFKAGDHFIINPSSFNTAPYSWDWRWVFALKILYKNHLVIPLKFNQKVIALPTGNNPLSMVFFKNVADEFKLVIDNFLYNSESSHHAIYQNYEKYVKSAYIN